MGECQVAIRELRIFFREDSTDLYIRCDAWGNCPPGIAGWHYRAFPPDRPAVDILRFEIKEYIWWPQQAPPTD